MFSGIVTHRGTVRRAARWADGGLRLGVEPRPATLEAALGDSVAVDGVCLTVAGAERGALLFDVVPETLRRTTLGDLAPGGSVNLERALRLGDPVSGHWVQGHVEGTGTVVAVEARGDDVRLSVRVDADLHGAVIPKGSVTLDGVSLTVGEVWRDGAGDPDGRGRFSVYLIPHTLAVTGLSAKRVGDRVNVEPDLVGRWVEHHVRALLRKGEDGADLWRGTDPRP
jgi:riboflavin synthase alpha subunit